MAIAALDPAELHWYAVYCNVRCEYRAQAGLREAGFDAYCPSETKWAHHARRKVAVQRPYLARYLFVGVDHERQGFHQIRGTDGVERIVGVTGTPVRIPYGWIKDLREAETLGEFDYTVDRNRLVVEPGRQVRVIGGPFTGFMAKIIEARGDKRVRVLLQEMGKLAPGPLEIDIEKLEAA
jgi:transcriptional antiterminator RfaH